MSFAELWQPFFPFKRLNHQKFLIFTLSLNKYLVILKQTLKAKFKKTLEFETS